MEWVIPAMLVLLLVWASLTRARLRRLRQEAVAAWPPLEALLRQRHGLITPLAQALQTLAPKTPRPVQAMINARKTAAIADLSPRVAGHAEQNLAAAIEGVRSLADRHTELSHEPRFQQILASLDALAEDIAAAQDRFNSAVYAYNLACVGIPAIIVAKYLSFWKLEYFGLDGEALDTVDQIERGQAPQRHEPMI